MSGAYVMSQNRLNLDFKIELREDRVKYIEDYLKNIRFSPNEQEVEMMGKYILWGKTSKDDKNGNSRLRAEGFELETRSGTWDSGKTESLDALLEIPGFNEASLLQSATSPAKTPRQVFSREEARRLASPDILAIYEPLWRHIDELEVEIGFYDLKHNRRQSELRPQLLQRFSKQDLDALKASAESISSFTYLNLKHQLVDLRQQQYNYQDSFKPMIMSASEPILDEYVPPSFGDEIKVLPFGIPDHRVLTQKLWDRSRYPEPSEFSEEELEEISKLVWSAPKPSTGRFFDFSNPDHLYGLFENYKMLKEEAEDSNTLYSTLPYFMQALETYWGLARLEPMLEDILELKIEKKTNQEIADRINKKYSKSYKPNYISTLYCKKCLAQIAAASMKHKEVIENLFFSENFKKCKDCGRTLLLNEENFVRRHRSNDGFSPRCKCCEKIKRLKGQGE